MTRITIEMDDGEKVIKNVPAEDGDSNTWPELVENFFCAIRAFGYMLPAEPDEIARVLDAWRYGGIDPLKILEEKS